MSTAHTFTVDGIVYTPPRLPNEWHLRRPMIQLMPDFTGADGWQWTPSATPCEPCWLRYGRARVCMCRTGGE